MLQLFNRLFWQAKPLTFSDVAEQWLTFTRDQKKAPQAVSQVRRDLITRWGHRPRSDITRADVVAVIEQTALRIGNESARTLWSYTSRIMTWAVQRALIDRSPCEGLSVAAMLTAAKARDRILTPAEIKAVWLACEPRGGQSDDFSRIVRLLIITGLRRNEIGGLQWSELDRERMLLVIPKERMKGARPHTIPINQQMLDLLGTQGKRATHCFGRDRKGPFSGWSRAKARLDKRCGVKDWTIHDIRRTCSTLWNEQELALPYVIEAQLHHKMPGVAGIYNRSTYVEQRRELLDRWTAELARIVA